MARSQSNRNCRNRSRSQRWKELEPVKPKRHINQIGLLALQLLSSLSLSPSKEEANVELKKTKEQLLSSELSKKRVLQEAEEARAQAVAASVQVRDSKAQLAELSSAEEVRILELRRLSQEQHAVTGRRRSGPRDGNPGGGIGATGAHGAEEESGLPGTALSGGSEAGRRPDPRQGGSGPASASRIQAGEAATGRRRLLDLGRREEATPDQRERRRQDPALRAPEQTKLMLLLRRGNTTRRRPRPE